MAKCYFLGGKCIYATPLIFILFLGCRQLTSTPSSIKYVANEWRNICGVIFLEIPASLEYFFNIKRTDCSEKRSPRGIILNYPLYLYLSIFPTPVPLPETPHSQQQPPHSPGAVPQSPGYSVARNHAHPYRLCW